MGEDCTSSFKGKGKVAPLKKLEKNPRFHKCFKQLGDDWNVNADVLKEVEKFTCLMYGQSRETSVDGARVKLLRKMVGDGEKYYFQNESECFIGVSKHRETNESTRPQAECFYCFEVFGYPDETRSTSFGNIFSRSLSNKS